MKNYSVLFVVMLLFACTNKPKDPQIAVYVEEKLAAFIDTNPDWDENETEVTDKFQHKAIHWSNEADFLKNMPLRLQKIVDTTESGQAVKMAHFNAFLDDKRNEESLLNHMQLHIKGIVSESQVARLKIGESYLLSGSLQRQGKRADVKFIKLADGNNYHLGSYTFLITGFKHVKF